MQHKSRFNNQVPHYSDTQLLERCQEQLRDYDIYYKGWTEPRDHTTSYLAAAYIELAQKYEQLTQYKLSKQDLEALSIELDSIQDEAAAEAFEQSVFAAQMDSLESDINAEGRALVEELGLDED